MKFQNENIIVENNGSWNLFTNLLFVDQPVGSGFSYIDTDSVIHELDEMANQFLDFLDRYIEILPELFDQDIYLAGESFASQYQRPKRGGETGRGPLLARRGGAGDEK